MRFGTAFFVLLVAGYVGFELYALQRNRYRMEPQFIFGNFVMAARAADVCGVPKRAAVDQFQRRYATARQRAIQAQAQANPKMSVADITARIGDQEETVSREIDALVGEQGCKGKAVWKLQKRFENLAR
jgi:predicted HTH transcriptional regulator